MVHVTKVVISRCAAGIGRLGHSARGAVRCSVQMVQPRPEAGSEGGCSKADQAGVQQLQRLSP